MLVYFFSLSLKNTRICQKKMKVPLQICRCCLTDVLCSPSQTQLFSTHEYILCLLLATEVKVVSQKSYQNYSISWLRTNPQCEIFWWCKQFRLWSVWCKYLHEMRYSLYSISMPRKYPQINSSKWNPFNGEGII